MTCGPLFSPVIKIKSSIMKECSNVFTLESQRIFDSKCLTGDIEAYRTCVHLIVSLIKTFATMHIHLGAFCSRRI